MAVVGLKGLWSSLIPTSFKSSHWSCHSLRLHLPPRNEVSVGISGRLLRIFCFGKPTGTLFLLSNLPHTILTPSKFLFLYIVKCTSQLISSTYIWWKTLFHWPFKGLNKITLFLKQSFLCMYLWRPRPVKRTRNYCRFVLVKGNIILIWLWI